MLLLILTACLNRDARTADQIAALEERLAALEAQASPELEERVVVLELALAEQADRSEATAAELEALAERLAELEAGGDPAIRTEVDALTDDLAALRLELDELAGNVAGLLENGPAVWSLAEDVPTGGQDAEAWSSVHAAPLTVDLSGGPVVAYCWVSSNMSRYPQLRMSLTDSTGAVHTSSVANDETRADRVTREYLADEQLFIMSTFSGVAPGPAEVSCEGYAGYFWTVELMVADLGI